jgi:hypothetical protein
VEELEDLLVVLVVVGLQVGHLLVLQVVVLDI